MATIDEEERLKKKNDELKCDHGYRQTKRFRKDSKPRAVDEHGFCLFLGILMTNRMGGLLMLVLSKLGPVLGDLWL